MRRTDLEIEGYPQPAACWLSVVEVCSRRAAPQTLFLRLPSHQAWQALPMLLTIEGRTPLFLDKQERTHAPQQRGLLFDKLVGTGRERWRHGNKLAAAQ
jgi:hypothetical protein